MLPFTIKTAADGALQRSQKRQEDSLSSWCYRGPRASVEPDARCHPDPTACQMLLGMWHCITPCALPDTIRG